MEYYFPSRVQNVTHSRACQIYGGFSSSSSFITPFEALCKITTRSLFYYLAFDFLHLRLSNRIITIGVFCSMFYLRRVYIHLNLYKEVVCSYKYFVLKGIA